MPWPRAGGYTLQAPRERPVPSGNRVPGVLLRRDGRYDPHDRGWEITGIHVSDGDPSDDGLLGSKIPRPFHDGWRVFYTQQHGDNFTWEVLPARPERWEDRDDD
jgi:hypothetical protein